MKAILSAFLSGILIAFAWPNWNVFPLLFCCLVPLFMGITHLRSKPKVKQYITWWFMLFSFRLFWVGINSFWLKSASLDTYLIGICVDSFVFSLCLFPAIFLLNKGKGNHFHLFFCALWILFEWLSQQWALGIPYFILGNGLGKFPFLIQQYEWIGIEGGTVWLLSVNVLLFLLLKAVKNAQKWKRFMYWSAAVIVFPMIIAHLVLMLRSNNTSTIKVACLSTHFSSDALMDVNNGNLMIDSLYKLSAPAFAEKVQVLVWPETIVKSFGWIAPFALEKSIDSLQAKLPDELTLILGGFAYSQQQEQEDPYVQKMSGYDVFYLTHNVAFSLQSTRANFRVKELFVPFQERVPFLKWFPSLKHLMTNVGSNVKVSPFEEEKLSFPISRQFTTLPVLCYESLFPLKMAALAKENSVLSILANESWNERIFGSKQYLYSSPAMAIQSRIPIIKSSNNGFSTIINSMGELTMVSSSENEVLIDDVTPKTHVTIYESIAGYSYLFAMIFAFFSVFLVYFNKKH